MTLIIKILGKERDGGSQGTCPIVGDERAIRQATCYMKRALDLAT